MKRLLKIISLILILIIASTSLLSCSARPLAQGSLAKKVVGTVGAHDVYYEEFYFLANNYYNNAKIKYGNDTEAINKFVWDSVNENITANYAILDLCEAQGLEYNKKELNSEIEQNIETTITSTFEGNRNEYLKSQLSAGLTDHYYRFCLKTDILYGKLATKYQENGKIPNTDEKIKAYIKENFIHTWHIAIYVDKGDDRDAEYAKALEAQQHLELGNYSMFNLIGSEYNENTMPESLTNAYGYYFPRGIMEKGYEDAAFALKNVGDRTEIISSYSTSPSGAYVECFYIIEKLAVKDSEIEANFNDLSDMIRDSVLANDLEEYQSKLSFKPNDYVLSLDVTALEAPKNGADYTLIIGIIASVLGVALIITAIFVFRNVRAKRFHKKHKKQK